MKTGLAVALAALVLSTGCSGNPPRSSRSPAAAARPARRAAGRTGRRTGERAGGDRDGPPTTPVATTTHDAGRLRPRKRRTRHRPPACRPSRCPPRRAPETTRAAAAPRSTKPQDPLELMRQNEETTGGLPEEARRRGSEVVDDERGDRPSGRTRFSPSRTRFGRALRSPPKRRRRSTEKTVSRACPGPKGSWPRRRRPATSRRRPSTISRRTRRTTDVRPNLINLAATGRARLRRSFLYGSTHLYMVPSSQTPHADAGAPSRTPLFGRDLPRARRVLLGMR